MKQAEWIWYPDDFEIELSGKFMAERYERDIPIPPFWRLDSCYKNVKFKKIYELSAAETVKIEAEGSFNVMDETIKYWGVMIKEGATTFWERYDPEEKGAEKYAMYGRKYGKSLCHAWGATPLYIIGRYIVGLKASENGKSFTLKPDLAGLKRFKAEMPLAKGSVKIEADEKTIRVISDEIKGTLIVNGKNYVVEPKKEIEVAI